MCLRAAIPLLFLLAMPSLAADPRQRMRGAQPPEKYKATVIVGINAMIGGVAEPGWPLIITALIDREEGAQVKLPALRLKITGPKGAPVALKVEAAKPPPAEANDVLYWVAPEEATKDLAVGQYNFAVEGDAAAVKGLRLESGDLKVEAKNPANASMLSTLKIQRSLLGGNEGGALAEAEKAIVANPNDANAWLAKGDLLMAKDEPDSALEAYDKALALYSKSGGENLLIMRKRADANRRALEKRTRQK